MVCGELLGATVSQNLRLFSYSTCSRFISEEPVSADEVVDQHEDL